jgi:hypothetical protein
MKTVLAFMSIACMCASSIAAEKPLKVYILAGQSNMVGNGSVETFDYIGDDPATAPMLKEMRGPDGKPRVCERVWISWSFGATGQGGRIAMLLLALLIATVLLLIMDVNRPQRGSIGVGVSTLERVQESISAPMP